ncbi:MAG: hypothetical protein AB4080_10975 [Trichodesmium sp.]
MKLNITSGSVFAKSAGTALLAASASLFAATEASAFELIRGNNGAVIGIEDLEVGSEKYDVDIVFDSYNNIFGGDLDFESEATARSAGEAIIQALGVSDSFGGTDSFLIPFSVGERIGVALDGNSQSANDGLAIADVGASESLGWAPYADFTLQTSETPAATPEPSLMLGFITLGGLMLGSKIKTKG